MPYIHESEHLPINRQRKPPPDHAEARALLLKLVPDAKHAVEVGVWRPDFSHMSGFIMDRNCLVQLVEPQPEPFKELVERWGHFDNVRLHQRACTMSGEDVKMVRGDYGSPACYIEGTRATQRNFQKRLQSTFLAEGLKFSEIDDGTIDVLSSDTEGSDWNVIANLVSRPKVIAVEMVHGKDENKPNWRNPNTRQIEVWMTDNGYTRIDRVGGDYVYRLG